MLNKRVLGFGVLKQNGGEIRYLKGDTECRNNHRDDGIEEPLGTVEHLTQYGGMYVHQQPKSDPLLLLFTLSLYGGKIESYKHDSVIQ